MDDFLYVSKWSTDFTDQFIKDFVSVQNQVLFRDPILKLSSERNM